MCLVPPQIEDLDINKYPSVVINRTLILNCPVSGFPTPQIHWLKNNDIVDPLLHPNLHIVGGGRQLRFDKAQVSDAAVYQCLVINKAGEDSISFTVEVHGMLP